MYFRARAVLSHKTQHHPPQCLQWGRFLPPTHSRPPSAATNASFLVHKAKDDHREPGIPSGVDGDAEQLLAVPCFLS